MGLSGIKKLLLSSAVFLAVLHPVNSLSADSDELRQRLEQLQKSLQGAAPDESLEELEKKLQALKELLNKEGITEYERQDLEDRLKTVKGQLIPQERPLIAIEEAATTEEKRFFIEGKYWLAYIEGGDKEVASLYNRENRQTIGALETTLGSANAFIISGGYRHTNGNATHIRFWSLDTSGSVARTATSITGISATEVSDDYYQNKIPWSDPNNPWTQPFSTKGVNSADASSSLNVSNLDILHTVAIGKGINKEFGVSLGLKYAQVDNNYRITYASATSPIYTIESKVENTLIGPAFGFYGEGPVYDKLRFRGLLGISLVWNHIKAKRLEYDNWQSQVAVDARQAYDLSAAVIDGELGASYRLSQNLLFGLDYKTSYFNGLPFEFKPTESTLIDTVELLERDVLFHGLTAGVSYSF